MALLTNPAGRVVSVPNDRVPYYVERGFAPPPDAPPAPNLADLTVAELRQYALENGIDLGPATKKADILAALAT